MAEPQAAPVDVDEGLATGVAGMSLESTVRGKSSAVGQSPTKIMQRKPVEQAPAAAVAQPATQAVEPGPKAPEAEPDAAGQPPAEATLQEVDQLMRQALAGGKLQDRQAVNKLCKAVDHFVAGNSPSLVLGPLVSRVRAWWRNRLLPGAVCFLSLPLRSLCSSKPSYHRLLCHRLAEYYCLTHTADGNVRPCPPPSRLPVVAQVATFHHFSHTHTRARP